MRIPDLTTSRHFLTEEIAAAQRDGDTASVEAGLRLLYDVDPDLAENLAHAP